MVYCHDLKDFGLRVQIDASPSSFGCTIIDSLDRAQFSVSQGRPASANDATREGRFANNAAIEKLCRSINRWLRTYLHRPQLSEVLTLQVVRSCFLNGSPLPADSPWYLQNGELGELGETGEETPLEGLTIFPDDVVDLPAIDGRRVASGAR
jgi:hypothetical protein